MVSASGDVSLSSGNIGGAAKLDRGLIALLQSVANLMEGQELPPASLDSAGTRDTMTLTRCLHSRLDYLEHKGGLLTTVKKNLEESI